ncbi:TPA: hypothetical protein RJD49_001628 [Legionella pneumophila]|nr:hypothetical protein [Legionella pneumophila]HDV5806220.1 hypothetical protein [Legionella pneumophila]
MHRFHNILFDSHRIKDKTEALPLVLRLIADNQAQLHILITYSLSQDKPRGNKTTSLVNKERK